jgi:malonyl-CoA/methylmalonyl-CoA synthetase
VRIEQVPAWAGHLRDGAGAFQPDDLSVDGTLLRRWARLWAADGDRTVLVDDRDPSRHLTAAALQSATAAVAAALARLGVGPGDRVLWSSPPSIDSAVWLLGALRLGAVVVPVSPSLTESELAFVINDVRPVAAMTGPEQQPPVLRAAPGLTTVPVDGPPADAPRVHGGADLLLDLSRPNDDALIVFTSGTTGNPKGAVHTHRSLLAGVEAVRLAWGWEPDDHLILSLPLFHVHGLCAGLFGTLAAGASATVMDRFDPERVLESVSGSSMFFGVPTMYHRLGQTGRAKELATLRLCVAGSAPLAADLWRAFDQEGVPVLERYGMSETLLTLSNPLVGERRPGSVGLPLPGTEAMVHEPGDDGIGELLVRGPSLCRGYWERPEATSASWRQGWFATGDLASVADDGYFSIRGRNTELIITGGHNVYPAELEAVLGRHPSVGEVAVVGVASPEWGESVVAFVAGADGPPDIDALEQLAASQLAPFKRPREYRVLSALPRNAMGKVVRRDLH